MQPRPLCDPVNGVHLQIAIMDVRTGKGVASVGDELWGLRSLCLDAGIEIVDGLAEPHAYNEE